MGEGEGRGSGGGKGMNGGKGEGEVETSRWGGEKKVRRKGEGEGGENGGGGRKRNGEMGREGESHAFQFCQLESSESVMFSKWRPRPPSWLLL